MKAFAAILILPYLLSTGCFVVTGERRIKPVVADNMIKKGADSRRDLVYYRHFERAEFNIDAGVVNNAPAKWELQFLFNILPCNVYRVKETTWPLIVVIYFEPKLPGITFQPGQVLLLETNQQSLPPRNIWLDDRFVLTNSINSLPITNGTTFRLAFTGEKPRHLDQGRPFQLSIEGIRVSGETIFLPPIDFRPGTTVRPGFRLPY